MNIDLIYVLIAFVCLLIGFVAGWFLGRRFHELNRMKRVMRAKNPELWDLEHYVAVDEDVERRERTTRTDKKKTS